MTIDMDEQIKRNLVRKFVFEFLSQQESDLWTSFPVIFEEWNQTVGVENLPPESRTPVHVLCDQLYKYLSSKSKVFLPPDSEVERLLGAAINKESDEYLEIGERVSQQRFDLWGNQDESEEETTGYFRDNLIGEDPVWLEAISLAARAAKCSFPVLITGETETGKEMIARQIHAYRRFGDSNCMVINCGAIPESLIESELFGYAPGAFTGAASQGKTGWIERAAGGTLILDEIGLLPQNGQTALLRVLQEGELQKVGGKILKINFRLIAISNRSLEELIEKGKFRLDLYYRINVINIHLPRLNERHDDIELFAEYFLERYIRANKNLPARSISHEAVTKLKAQEWQGNVRELENVIARALVLSRDRVIGPQHLVFPDLPGLQSTDIRRLSDKIGAFDETGLSRINITKLADFLTKNHERITTSGYARTLNISHSTARRQLGILVRNEILTSLGRRKGAYYVMKI